MTDLEDLHEAADAAVENAHTPYSDYQFGAAVLTRSGEIFTGCNVEVITQSQTTHAEQNAITTAVTNGHTDFERLVIVGNQEEAGSPCGHCRQIMAEFCDTEFPIQSFGQSERKEWTLGELLPHAFGD